MKRALGLLFAFLTACGPSAGPPPKPAAHAAAAVAWADATQAPWPGPEHALPCPPDGALARVAQQIGASGDADADRATALLRAAGAPYVRVRVLVGSPDDGALRSMQHAHTRCGVAQKRDGSAVVVVADALADLEPLAARARTGAWLELAATLRVPAAGAHVVLLGERGLPRTVPTWLDRETGRVRARFALDHPGAFDVQLVADLAEGPRPVLDARVFADVDPSLEREPAPGEDVAGDDDVALAAMVAAARDAEALRQLRRDPRLDALAQAHVDRMRAARAVAHDVGDGDLALRLQETGLTARVIGENVSRAKSLPLAHRAIHASPSHRLNLLHAQYTHLGVAVARDPGGTVWVCEVFSSPLR